LKEERKRAEQFLVQEEDLIELGVTKCGEALFYTNNFLLQPHLAGWRTTHLLTFKVNHFNTHYEAYVYASNWKE
jgi:hypothetical protein